MSLILVLGNGIFIYSSQKTDKQLIYKNSSEGKQDRIYLKQNRIFSNKRILS